MARARARQEGQVEVVSDSQRVRELLASLDETVTEVRLRSASNEAVFEVTLKRQPKAQTQVFGQQPAGDDLAGFGQFMPPVPIE
jgi:hypothetical protein